MSVNILDLEEAADLRVEDVRAYLERKGWTLKNYPPGTGQTWTDPAGKESFIMKDGWEWWMDSMVEAAVDFENRTPQAILREMNPRLRKGAPSPQAKKAHSKNGGVWIATQGKLGQWGSIAFVSWEESRMVIWDGEEWHYPDVELTETLSEWSFWPCDEHGNKVPWPRDAEGREL